METLKNGTHFWALIYGKLVVLVKTKNGFFVAGNWENHLDESVFQFICKIEKPVGFEEVEDYYK